MWYYASSTMPPTQALLQLCYIETHDLVECWINHKCRPWTPESVGDYASGTNHVLPTYGYARMYSGVSLDSFQKKMTVQVVQDFGFGKERSKRTPNRAVWVAADEGLSQIPVSHIALWHGRCICHNRIPQSDIPSHSICFSYNTIMLFTLLQRRR